jgi:hypothetical protein
MSDVNGSIYGLVGFGFGWVRNNEESFGWWHCEVI